MKKEIRFATRFCLPLLLFCLSSGCMKDKVTRTYKISTPIYEVLTTFRESVKSQSPTAIENTGKLTVVGKIYFPVRAI
ncbi:MAG: hypothetical protein WDM78_04855 [Puia sp.]